VCKPNGTIVIINHFRSSRPWIAIPIDLLDPLTRRFGWCTTLRADQLLHGLPLRVERDYKTSWNSLFRVIIARRLAVEEFSSRAMTESTEIPGRNIFQGR
jgi:hypothetical protein